MGLSSTPPRDFNERVYASHPGEEKAVQYFKSRGCQIVRYGPEKINKNMPWYDVPRIIRNTPDYICSTPNILFLEVKTLKNNTCKLKVNDLKSYKYWNKYMSLYFFVNNADTGFKEVSILHIGLIEEIIRKNMKSIPMGYFDNNKDKKYWDIPKELFPDWRNVEPEKKEV
jgi:hypothetical protein